MNDDAYSGGTSDNWGSVTATIDTGLASPSGSTFGGPAANRYVPHSEEPIDLSTGNYTHQHTDASMSGKGPPLTFSRSYNALDSSSGPLGAAWTHNYNTHLLIDSSNPSAKIITVVNESGRQDAYNEQPDGTYRGPPGIFDKLTENGDGSFALKRSDRSILQFNASGVLQSITDRNGNVTSLTYDGSGNLTSVTDSSGRSLTFAYDGSGHTTSVADPLGRATTYGYDGSGNLISATDPEGETTSYTYDSAHRMLSITDPRGHVIMTNVFDSQGRVSQQTNALGKSWNFTYDPSTLTTTETDPLGHHTTYVYDDYHRTISQTDARGGVTSYTYDAYGNRDSVTDALGRTTHMAYDERGNLLSTTDALGNTTTFTYSPQDDLLSKTDALGRTTTYTYDVNGNLVTSTDALGGVTGFTYNGAGQMLTSTDPRGKTSSFTYDADGYQNSVTDPLGHTTSSTYDAGGRLLFQTDPLGHTTTFTYDDVDRLLTVTDARGHTTTYGYDANGNKTSVVDANGKLTSYTYDALNRLESVTDAEGGTVTYSYDELGNRASMTDANGHTTTYGYDALNRLASVTDPVGSVTRYTYDAVGNRTGRLDANGITTTYSYDALNRLTKITYPDQPAVSYTYDSLSDRTSMTDLTGTTTYLYDPVYRLIAVTSPGGGVVCYTYDAAGNRTSITYPDGKVVSYGYDDASRMSTVTDWASRVTTYTYDNASRLTSTGLPNGVHTARSYNDANQLLQIAHTSAAGNLMTIGYSVDNVGNRLTRSETVGTDPTLTDSYGYDSLYRLTSVDYGNPAYADQTYSYDPMGNRTRLVEGTTTTNYAYDAADRLLTAGSTNYAFDANGNQTREGNRTFTYDRENRLTQVADWTSSPDGVCADANWDGVVNSGDLLAIANAFGTRAGSDAYQPITDPKQDGVVNSGDLLLTAGKLMQQCRVADADTNNGDGLRIYRSEAGGNVRYLWNEENPLPLILEQSDGTSFAYGQELLLQEKNTSAAWYLQDVLGSTVGAASGQGAVNASYGYDVFGRPRSSANAPFSFTGQQTDTSSLVYMRTRYYDPSSGRFGTRDPLRGRSGSTQAQYVYVDSSPVQFTDPFGLCAQNQPQVFVEYAMVSKSDQGSSFWDPVGAFGKSVLQKLTGFCADCFSTGTQHMESRIEEKQRNESPEELQNWAQAMADPDLRLEIDDVVNEACRTCPWTDKCTYGKEVLREADREGLDIKPYQKQSIYCGTK